MLIDTGMGVDDLRGPYRNLGVPFTAAFRPMRDTSQTALEEVRRLGFAPGDVRHIACTHLDLDHAGGLPDFPHAEVHTFKPEYQAAIDPTLRDRMRYPSGHFAHAPKWQVHDVDGDEWFGFQSIRVLPGVDPKILMIPLVGHTRGHTAIAVRGGDGWLLHCGDAYFHRGEVETPPHCPPGLAIFQKLMAQDDKVRAANQQRLRELARTKVGEVRLFCAHDPVELERESA